MASGVFSQPNVASKLCSKLGSLVRPGFQHFYEFSFQKPPEEKPPEMIENPKSKTYNTSGKRLTGGEMSRASPRQRAVGDLSLSVIRF